jgi:predicted RNase H-like HicB family nuclease
MKKRKMTLTGLIKKEGNQYAALCLELDVVSSGSTQAGAIAALRDAIETYIEYLVGEEREPEIYRPVPLEALREFLMGREKSRRVTYTFHAIPLEYSYAA